MSSCDGRNLCSTSVLGGYCSSTYDGVGGAMDNKGEKEKTSKKRCMDAMEGREEMEQEIEDEEDSVKKRRLSFEQVKTLEKNFELGNKLDPEKKLQLAKSLGLQPRQIAVWFQNRRARWKTKQLEKDFDSLKRDYDSLMSRYNALLEEKHHFKAEVERLNKELELKGMRKNDKMEEEFFFEHERKPVKTEVCGECTEPKMQGDMNQQQHQQEGGCSSIISEASSVFNLDSPHNNMDSPPLESKDTMKNSHDASLYCPKIENGQDDDGRETGLGLVPCYGLFYGLEDQETLLWEYWNPDS